MVQLLQDDKKPATGWQSVSDDTHAWQQQTWRLIHHWSQPPFPFPFIICVTIGLNRVFGLITITMISCYSWKHVQGRSRKSGYIHYTAKGSFFRQRESVWILLNKWYDRARMVCAVMGLLYGYCWWCVMWIKLIARFFFINDGTDTTTGWRCVPCHFGSSWISTIGWTRKWWKWRRQYNLVVVVVIDE